MFGLVMSSPTWSFVAIAALLIARGPVHIRKAPAAPQETQQSPETNGTGTDFDAARRLSQQGKYDEAVAALRELAASHPETKGLSHEFGLVYYKKNDFVNA